MKSTPATTFVFATTATVYSRPRTHEAGRHCSGAWAEEAQERQAWADPQRRQCRQ
jgi:hypothetical protein